MSTWERCYDASGEEPRETLLAARDVFAEPGLAVDLDCGPGRDRGEHESLETQVARYEDVVLPRCDLVNASYSLPFCAPEHFADVWQRVVATLRPGGRFCGQLFGDRDECADADDMTFHSRARAEELFEAFALERFDEVEEDSRTAVGQPKHWHLFHVVARKR